MMRVRGEGLLDRARRSANRDGVSLRLSERTPGVDGESRPFDGHSGDVNAPSRALHARTLNVARKIGVPFG
jgi:hypothetical protein